MTPPGRMAVKQVRVWWQMMGFTSVLFQLVEGKVPADTVILTRFSINNRSIL